MPGYGSRKDWRTVGDNVYGAPNAPAPTSSPLEDLTHEFQVWTGEQNLPEEGDATELLLCADLTADQRRWLSDFIDRWEAAQKIADSLKPVRFTFDFPGDVPTYSGFANGDSWNGYSVVWVSQETLDRLKVDLELNDEETENLAADATGLIPLVGFTPEIV